MPHPERKMGCGKKTGARNPGEKGKGPCRGGGENDLPFAKRRKVQGEGLKLKRQVHAARVKEEAE